jgi:hypothetical protein
MSSSLTTLGIALANVACSVSLVLVNKAVFSLGFNFPMSLTCLHFVFTVAFYRALAGCAFFEMRPIPQTEAFKIAGFGVGSIGFMNISLHLNSVGFYQITKLAVVPCTLVAQVRARRVPRSRFRSSSGRAVPVYERQAKGRRGEAGEFCRRCGLAWWADRLPLSSQSLVSTDPLSPSCVRALERCIGTLGAYLLEGTKLPC